MSWVMPDAGYVNEDDITGLTSILRRCRESGDMVAPLALSVKWLKQARVPALVDLICEYGVPVALILEHSSDPLGAQDNMQGLLQLLTVPVPVMLLRSDISAIGALCFGATAAAVGVTSSLRHLYPQGSGGFPPNHGPSLLLGPCLAYKLLSRLERVAEADPDSHIWVCRCRCCYGRPVMVLGERANRELSCAEHSIDLLYNIRDQLLGRPLPANERMRGWIETCSHAATKCMELVDEFQDSYWKPPKALIYWQEVGSERLSELPDSEEGHRPAVDGI